jgi:hypothetical protein
MGEPQYSPNDPTIEIPPGTEEIEIDLDYASSKVVP